MLDFAVDILLKATGDAPIIKQKKWTVDRTKKVAYVAEFMKKLLKFKPEESLVSAQIILFNLSDFVSQKSLPHNLASVSLLAKVTHTETTGLSGPMSDQ